MPTVIPAVAKALKILELTSRNEAAASTSQLSRQTGMSGSTCYRAVTTLRECGWIVSSEGEDRLQPGSKMLQLSRDCAQFEERYVKIQEVLNALVEQSGLSAKYSERSGDEGLTRLRANSTNEFSLSGRPGARFTLLVGSSGAALLAAENEKEIDALIATAPETAWKTQTAADFKQRLIEGKKRGIYRDYGSYRPSVNSLSISILDQDKNLAGAITLLGHPEDFEVDAVKRFSKLLKESASMLKGERS